MAGAKGRRLAERAAIPVARSLPKCLSRFDPLRTVAVAVMIDGSARASQIATTIKGALREFTQVWKAALKMPAAEGPDPVDSRLSGLTALLGEAERELIAAARADFGVPD